MPTESFSLRRLIAAKPSALYLDWLEGARHAAMTRSPATGEARVGAAFTAWGGYISGHNEALTPNQKIVQRWRTSEFPKESASSLVTITLNEHPEGTELFLEHAEIPEGQGERYKSGWDTHYFQPMDAFYQR